MNAPFKVKLFGAPVWKAKVVPHFPARVNANSPITLTSSGGGIVQTIGLDLPSLLDALTAIINIELIIDAGGVVITTGVKGDIELSFGGTILQWTLLADQTGDISFDIRKNTFANFPPAPADSICGGNFPTMSSSIKAQSSNLAGWNQTITPGSIFRFNVNSVAAIKRVTLSLKCQKDWSV